MKILRVFLFLIFLLFSSLTIVSYLKTHDFKTENKGAVLYPATDLVLMNAYETVNEFYKQKLMDEYHFYYNQNNDYVGWIEFESGIISEAVMYSGDNEKYLRKDFNLKQDGKGTVFMDMDCSVDSKNITMYGHYVYYDENAKFSPLHLLKEQNSFDENSIITFQLKDEIRTYEVFAVYYYDWEKEAGYFYQTADFQTDEGFLRHVRKAKERSMIESNLEITAEDHLLTLQTCVRNRNDLRLIVVAKEIERK